MDSDPSVEVHIRVKWLNSICQLTESITQVNVPARLQVKPFAKHLKTMVKLLMLNLWLVSVQGRRIAYIKS